MNKQLFIDISEHLKSSVPALRWIDYDSGQLDQERPPVSFPCCLLDVVYPNCDDNDNEQQQVVNAEIVVRMAFAPIGATNSNVAINIRTQALNVFDTIEAVHKALQSWTDNHQVSPLSRKGGQREKRRDGMPVYRVPYRTTFIDIP